MKQIFRLWCCHVMAAAAIIMLASCEKPMTTDSDNANCRLTFSVTNSDIPSSVGSAAGTTRATVHIGDYFQKLNIMLFDSIGDRAFDKVKTQLATDDDFGTLSCQLTAGTYTVVAVGHSSIKSATIKSTEMVQFTASDGEKLTDTFVYCGSLTVGSSPSNFNLTMHRATAMIQIEPVDVYVPDIFDHLVIGYTGGSANVNPSTLEGCTKSNQSELRQRSAYYQVFTFPYQADSCLLKMTITAYDADGNAMKQRTLTDVPVTRNRITRCYGTVFDDGTWQYTQATFGFSVNPDWDGVNEYTF